MIKQPSSGEIWDNVANIREKLVEALKGLVSDKIIGVLTIILFKK